MPVQKTTRKEIINKCVERFRIHGFHSTTMSDLAAACGLQKGSFYHYFTSKDEILREGLQQTGAYFQAEVFAIAYNEAISPEKRMKSMLAKHTTIMLREQGGCLVANIAAEALTTNPDVKPLLMEISNNWHRSLVHILLAYYPREAAQELAWRIIQDIEGAMMLTKLYDNKTFIHEAVLRAINHCKPCQDTASGAAPALQRKNISHL
jgi:TetR/AcrR family transcriptional repressor of nem operon